MSDITNRVAKVLRDVDCRCPIHGGDNSYAALADAVVEELIKKGVISLYRDKGRCDSCGCDSCEPPPRVH